MKLLKIFFLINVIIIFFLSCDSAEKSECINDDLDSTYLFFESGFLNDNVKIVYEDEIIFDDKISTIKSIDLAMEFKIDKNISSEFSLYVNDKLVGLYCLKKFLEIDKSKIGIDLKSVDKPKKYQ